MKITNKSIQALINFLKALPANKPRLTDNSRSKVLELLQECWPYLNGSSEHSTHSDKIYRAENLRWKPPVLYFELERHGGTVNGSSRADVHNWEVDIDEGTATIAKIGRRQLEKMSPRMDTKAKAAETADNILNGLDHPSLIWDDNREYVVLVISKIIPESNAQTTQSRRKRYRENLEAILDKQGWVRKDKGNKLGFLKVNNY